MDRLHYLVALLKLPKMGRKLGGTSISDFSLEVKRDIYCFLCAGKYEVYKVCEVTGM